jgi:dephospho-CoA kinase
MIISLIGQETSNFITWNIGYPRKIRIRKLTNRRKLSQIKSRNRTVAGQWNSLEIAKIYKQNKGKKVILNCSQSQTKKIGIKHLQEFIDLKN